MLIFIDTISLLPKVTIIKNNKIIVSSKIITTNNDQISENIIKNLIKIFNKKINLKDVKQVCVCCGPGSYTSLRVGIAVAVGIKVSLNLPIYGFSAFDIILNFSKIHYNYNRIFILIQSSKNQNFIGGYNRNDKEIFNPYKLTDKKQFFFNGIKDKSILISNEKINNQDIVDANRFSSVININITNIFKNSNYKKIKMQKNIIHPIYFSKLY